MPKTAGVAGKKRGAVLPAGGVPEAVRAGLNGDVSWLRVLGARHNNLKNVSVALPLGRFTCITGVSGSGKSSLINDILYEALARDLNGAGTTPGEHEAIDVIAAGSRRSARPQPATALLDKIIAIDQTPIGRTPRSNPATYIKVFDEIRDLFTKLPDSKLRGYRPGRFSFNVSATRGGGRCEACEGNGATRIEMDFLADVWVTCPVCEGHRFTRETRQIQYKQRSIADVLEMDVQQALEHFENVPRIRRMLQTLHDVGLDYIKLGQPSTTLSGGEAQRIKLARELVRKPTGRTIYVLDEPTTGLHFEDIRRLLAVLHGFVDAGNTVVVIEHNLDVVKTADWIIDLGPEGGGFGGRIVAEGTPEQVAAQADSHTGRALRDVLGGAAREPSLPDGTRRPRANGKPSAGAAKRSEEEPAAYDGIRVHGARQHNLKDISVEFPRGQMTVCTGVSGSGKTSFAIDTVFVEGYRRYVESLSAYARQFLGQMSKPRVDHVEGLSPAICIEQKAASKSPRSTVGTITEIYDYMRVLWARLGTLFCPRCQVPVGTQTVDEIVDRIMALGASTPLLILAPVRLGDGENYATLFARLKRSGYLRVRINGEITQTAMATTLDARRKHRVEVVVDRTIVRKGGRGRITESVEHALALGNGLMTLVIEPVERAEQDEATGEASHEHLPQREMLFSQKLACLQCGNSYEELSPHHLSFNSQMGWCETCEGLGVQRGAPAGEIIADPRRNLFEGAIAGWGRIDRRSPLGRLLTALCGQLRADPEAPLEKWKPAQRNALLFGSDAGQWMEADGGDERSRRKRPAGVRFQWRGFFPALDAAIRHSWSLRYRLHGVMADIPCLACRGGRLRPEPANMRLIPAGEGAAGAEAKTIVQVCELPLDAALAYFRALKLDARQRKIAGELLHEIEQRLVFLIDVGLEYLTLSRAAPTLSGGEAQRIRLASQIGSGLSGVLYVLDEPTIGLHPRDTGRLVRALHKLRNLGNTLLLVEHDREVIASADRLLDFGPRAGSFGGRIVAQGAPAEWSGAGGGARGGVAKRGNGKQAEPAEESLTRGYLADELAIPVPSNRRPVDEHLAARLATQAEVAPSSGGACDWLVVRGARQHNLKNIHVPIPLGRFVCVTGVSGSGKSSLVNDILWPGLAGRLQNASLPPGEHDEIEFVDVSGRSAGGSASRRAGRPARTQSGRAARSRPLIDKIINVDQSPIGTTPSSNPATYTGVFDWIRELFARLPESKLRGYQANRFSFNRPGGRCEACEGYGQKRIEMHFMPDVWVTCESCNGRRYTHETLEVRFKGRSIADVLDMRVAEALELFDNVPKIRRLLKTLADVGLDYVQLGQPAPTLSGGEAQRVKLAAELGKPDTGRTLYILDEPTTGLHFDDVRKLLDVLQRLADLGNSVIVIEHNLDVLKCADWIIDLGPEAGERGGTIVAMGTPEQLVCVGAASPGAAVADGAGRDSRTSEQPSAEHARDRSETGRPMTGQRPVPHFRTSEVSHTAVALAPVLAAGPLAERPVYDAAAHAQEEMQAEKERFGDVGKGVKMPWKVDGRRWHLEQRRSRGERETRWEPAALELVEQLVQKAGRGRFAETNWNERASVEIIGRDAPRWFLHALTGGEWLLELYFRVPSGRFEARRLHRELGLRTLDEREDLPVYGSEPRVAVRPRVDGHDVVVVYVHDRKEIDTPAFRKFIRAAVEAYFEGAGQ